MWAGIPGRDGGFWKTTKTPETSSERIGLPMEKQGQATFIIKNSSFLLLSMERLRDDGVQRASWVPWAIVNGVPSSSDEIVIAEVLSPDNR